MQRNNWLQREHDRNLEGKRQIIELITKAFLERELSSLHGVSDFLVDTAKKSGIISNQEEYYSAFENAHKERDATQLSKLFQHLSYMDLLGIVQMDRVDIPQDLMYQPENIDANTLEFDSLNDYLTSSDTRIAVSIASSKEQHSASSNEIDKSRPFAIHSVGKVFTGALMLKMIQFGIISESALEQSPQLDPKVLEKLPSTVKERLSNCTLRDLMLHKSGLGDYLMPYIQVIDIELQSAKNKNRTPTLPAINSPLDFTQFAENRIYPLDMVNPISGEKEHYSNIGILLIGLVIEHAYNSQPNINKKLSYDEILYEFILKPAGIQSFSTHNPGNGIVNSSDHTAPHIAGSPAGGYWMTVDDLGRFGQWIVDQCKDPHFLQLLKMHGKEFYDEKRNVIMHSGMIPSSSAMLKCYLETGTTVAVLSDQPALAPNFIPLLEDNVYQGNHTRKLSTTALVATHIDVNPVKNPRKKRVDFIDDASDHSTAHAKEKNSSISSPTAHDEKKTKDDFYVNYTRKGPGKK